MGSRTATNYWIDLVSLLVMVGLAVTGGLMYFVLPPGTGHSHTLFGMGRHDIGRIHFYLAVACTALLVLHLVLHWSWVCNVTARTLGMAAPSRGAQKAWGLGLTAGVVLFLAGGLVWTTGKVEPYPVADSPDGYRGRGSRREGHGALLPRENDERGASPKRPRGGRHGRGRNAISAAP